MARHSVKKSFLSSISTEWDETHEVDEKEYLTLIIKEIITKLVPENENTLIVMLLTDLLSHNALRAVVEYFSEQENLLKLLINVLANDSDSLLKSAEIRTPVNSADSDNSSPISLPANLLNNEDDQLEDSSKVSQVPMVKPSTEDRCWPSINDSTDLPSTNEATDKVLTVGELPAEGRRHEQPGEESNLDTRTEQFVSDAINNFFKLAPPTPVKSIPDQIQTKLQSEVSRGSESPPLNQIRIAAPVLSMAIEVQSPIENLIPSSDEVGGSSSDADVISSETPISENVGIRSMDLSHSDFTHLPSQKAEASWNTESEQKAGELFHLRLLVSVNS